MSIFNIFKRSPRFQDAAFQDLAMMLTEENENPTYKREHLNPSLLDFSLESLRHIDEYLEIVHKFAPIDDSDLMRVALRCGAYIGEVIRKHSPIEYHWLTYNEAVKHSKLLKSVGMYLGTMGVLWETPETMCFPLAKVCKYIENGSEDSAYFFAKIAIEGMPKEAKSI